MKRLLIIGAEGFGREVLSWSMDVPLQNRDWEVGGFLDANQQAIEGYDCNLSIFADPMTYLPSQGDCFICAIGHSATKLRVCNNLTEKDGSYWYEVFNRERMHNLP